MIGSSTASQGRLLTFQVGGQYYALPIAAVAEVTEVGRIAAVPCVPRSVAGVINYHGDALPVLERGALLCLEDPDPLRASHLLVLAETPDDANRYGMAVDEIGGLVDGGAAVATDEDPVAERRPLDGRLVNVLDPRRLLARAVEVIEQSVGITGSRASVGEEPAGTIEGGES